MSRFYYQGIRKDLKIWTPNKGKKKKINGQIDREATCKKTI